MHAPILDDDGAAQLQSEDLFVIEHPSFGAILDQIRDIIEAKKVPALSPKAVWREEIDETEIQTFLKKALEKYELEGQTFDLPANPSYRDALGTQPMSYRALWDELQRILVSDR